MLLKVPGPSQMEAALTALPHTAPSWWKFAGKFCRVPDISVLQEAAGNSLLRAVRVPKTNRTDPGHCRKPACDSPCPL